MQATERMKAERTPEETARIQKAKQLLMDELGLREEYAYTLLRRSSMNHGRRMTATADLVLAHKGRVGDLLGSTRL